MSTYSLKKSIAARVVESGGVVACPAEAVWGLSCNPFSAPAVMALLELKERPVHKGLIVVAAKTDMFEPVLQGLTSAERARVMISWPGPNTWLVPNHGYFPPWVTGDSSEVAIRVTSAPALIDLSNAVSSPIVSTSANPAGASPARWGFQVVRYFGSELPRSVGGVDLSAKPSTIRRVSTGEVLRA